ncbi:MAG: hypothetical protein R3D63_04860 [Paracoccaceae bacterium]
MTAGRITIHRRGGPRFDLLRGYRILVDGVAVGKLRRGGSLTVEHAPGRALIEARIDWCSAQPLAVPVVAGQEAVVEVRNARGMAGAMDANETRDPENYLVLELVSGAGAPAGPWG